MSSGKSIFITAALLSIIAASGLWLYRFYNVVPVGPGDVEAKSLGFTSSKRYSDIIGLVHNAKPRQSFSNSQFAFVEEVLNSTNDSVKAKHLAVISLMTIGPNKQRERAIELMGRHRDPDKNLDDMYRNIMQTYCLEGSRSIVEKAANGFSPISELAKQALASADERQIQIDASKKGGK